MKIITLVLTVALTVTITIIVTSAIGTPVDNLFRDNRLEAIVDVSRWHPYPTKGAAPLRHSFALLHLENPTSEKVTNIKVRFDGEAYADIIRSGERPEKLIVHAGEFNFPDMKPGDEALYYLWFDKPVMGRALEQTMRLFSSQGTPRLVLIESQMYDGEPFETFEALAREWMPMTAGLLSLVLVFAIAAIEGRNGKALRKALEDDDFYLGEKIRYEADPKAYIPSKPKK
ncbi:MAG TPA: hypothetical protein VIT45_17475 [Allosphingosinicella sp.]